MKRFCERTFSQASDVFVLNHPILCVSHGSEKLGLTNGTIFHYCTNNDHLRVTSRGMHRNWHKAPKYTRTLQDAVSIARDCLRLVRRPGPTRTPLRPMGKTRLLDAWGFVDLGGDVELWEAPGFVVQFVMCSEVLDGGRREWCWAVVCVLAIVVE